MIFLHTHITSIIWKAIEIVIAFSRVDFKIRLEENEENVSTHPKREQRNDVFGRTCFGIRFYQSCLSSKKTFSFIQGILSMYL